MVLLLELLAAADRITIATQPPHAEEVSPLIRTEGLPKKWTPSNA